MDVFPHTRRVGRRHRGRLACLIGLPVAVAAIAAAVADEPTGAAPGTPTPAFQPGEISIGEPIPLPFAGRGSPAAAPVTPATTAVPPTTAAPAVMPPADDPLTAAPPTAAAGDAGPGSGWLGLAVAESNVPGRWRIEEVAAGGPAARAGVAVGDELRAVNGVTLASAAEVTQTLTAIAAGQDVRVAVARADQVSDVVLRAEPRPAVRAEPPATTAAWQASQTPAPTPVEAAPRFVPTPAPVAAPLPLAAPLPTPASMPAPRAQVGGRTALGVRSVPVDPATQARFNLASPAGAYVVGVVHDLPAARAGVPPGSVIVALGDQPVRSPVELTNLVTKGPLDKPVTVQFVLPGGEAKRADVLLQALDAPLERALTEGPERATTPPELQPGPMPRLAERRQVDDGTIRPDVRTELRALRERLERLEQALAAPPFGGR